MKTRLPFQTMTARNWVNLALLASFTFYVIQIALDVVWGNTCGHLGTDFCAFWSAGRVANDLGYASVYDLGILREVQLRNFPAFGQLSTFAVSPVAYLPIFLLPFQLLSLLPATISFWIWTVFNVVMFVWYLRFFNKKMTGRSLPARLLLMVALSLPVYWNFLDGQINVWLMICVGEFLRRAMAGQSLQAGLWLGGLLLKPQGLVLIGLALILQRSIRTIAGLLASSAILVGSSLGLVGTNGALAMLRIWLGFAKGMPTNDVDSMMNWRMLAFHLSNWFSPTVGWTVAVAGIAITIIAAMYLWRRPIDWRAPSFTVAVLGTLAATGLVAWHSHIHMAMFLIPPLILLWQQGRLAEGRLLESWVLIPTAAYFLVFVLASLVKVHILPEGISSSLNFLRGGSEFGMNAWILILSMKNLAGESSSTLSNQKIN